jgi:diaminopimelate epimerase
MAQLQSRWLECRPTTLLCQVYTSQALGNDYLVLDVPLTETLPEDYVRAVCDRHYGLGSDGILVWSHDADGSFGLVIYNPDGSKAEKSGNGLRICARYLYDVGLVGGAPFSITTTGGAVTATVFDGGAIVRVAMGQAHFPNKDPIVLDIDGTSLAAHPVSMGNPHCVILMAADELLARRLGPLIENDGHFPGRTNVQFLEVVDAHNIRIQIWERGAGYTLASGSSSCAAAATAVRLGLCRSPLAVHMPGGRMDVDIGPSFDIILTGR